MPIFNKDGTEFRLNGPNQLAQDQNIPTGGYKLHNFNEKKKSKISEVTIEKIDSKKMLDEEKLIRISYKLNCLPADVLEIKDELYNETRRKVQYKQAIEIAAVIVKSDDVYFQFESESDVGIESIIHQMAERRWWIVKEKTVENSKFYYICIPSPITPYFGV